MPDPGDEPNPDTVRRAARAEEIGRPVEAVPDVTAETAENIGQRIVSGGPASWWRIGLAVLVVVALIVLIGRFVSGNSAGPNTQSAPNAAPAQQVVQ